MIYKLNSRSQSHVEMMLSFILFVSAIIFIFIFINPISKTQEKESDAKKVQEIIIRNISSNFGKLSIITNNSADCYDFSPQEYSEYNYIEKWENQNSRKYSILFSDIFDSVNAPNKSSQCPGQNYTLGSYSEEKIIVHEKIKLFKQNYESDYSSLRNSLAIKDDFSFSFKYINGDETAEISAYRQIPSRSRVDSENFPVRIINKSGDVKEFVINIKVW